MKNLKIKILFVFFIGALSVSCSYKKEKNNCVQTQVIEQSPILISEKKIYLFDVSESMIGKGSIITNNVFEKSRSALSNAIRDVSDPNTEIVVVPFSDTCFSVFEGSGEMNSLISSVDNITTKPGNTNIYLALDKAYAELDTGKKNSIYLISDGLHNEGATKEELTEKFKEWNQHSNGSNYLFLYAISPKAEMILDISRQINEIYVVDSLNSGLTYVTTEMELFSNDSLIEGVLKFSSCNGDLLTKILSNNIISLQENQYYEMDSIQVAGEQLTFQLKPINTSIDDTINLNMCLLDVNYPVVFLPNAFVFSVYATDCDEGMYVWGKFPMWILWLILAIILILLLLYILSNVGGVPIPIPGFGGIRIPKIPPLNNVVMPNKKQEDKPKKCEEEEWRMRVNRETGWPMSEVICYMNSEEEAEIYMKAKLEATQIGGRWALIRPEGDIDWAAFNCRKDWLKEKLSDYDKWKDYNNADLIGEGYPPRDENGDPYELHHIGQKQNSPFAELRWHEHMGDGNNKILHPQRESEIDRQLFDKEKSEYWQARYNQFDKVTLDRIYGKQI